jgi:Protein of unknown function (DUF1360)
VIAQITLQLVSFDGDRGRGDPRLSPVRRGATRPPEEKRPLGGYLFVTVLFHALVALAALSSERSGRELPERYPLSDVLLAGAATQGLARVIAKDKVTSFAEAPFTEYQGKGGPSEVEEAARGSGLLVSRRRPRG